MERLIRSVSVVFCPGGRERSDVKFTGEDLFVTYKYLAIPFCCGMLNLFFFLVGLGVGWFFKLAS